MRKVLICVLMAFVAGCSQQDRDSLARVGRKLIEHLEDTAASSADPVSSGFQAVRGSLGNSNLDCRVVLRLRWDRELEGCAIRVRTIGPTGVRLEGFLMAEGQRAKVVEVAKSTSGVENVEDKMQVKVEISVEK